MQKVVKGSTIQKITKQI